MKSLLFLLLAISLVSCSEKSNPVAPKNDNSQVAQYQQIYKTISSLDSSQYFDERYFQMNFKQDTTFLIVSSFVYRVSEGSKLYYVQAKTNIRNMPSYTCFVTTNTYNFILHSSLETFNNSSF